MKVTTGQQRRNAAALTAMLLSILLAVLLLSGCTASVNTADEQGLLPHLTVDLQVPNPVQPGVEYRFTIVVQQDGQPIEADKVTFEFWPEGVREDSIAMMGMRDGAGTYFINQTMPGEGVYVVRSLVSSANYEVMPAKRFAIGEEAVKQLALLEDQEASAVPAPSGGGHHH
ncbi:hypothetical protein EBB07_08350 [Paenibacillaceae bacterium]|nr:hypothetical protein EBB07_08350 [Paenibacillaceae bacterium]